MDVRRQIQSDPHGPRQSVSNDDSQQEYHVHLHPHRLPDVEGSEGVEQVVAASPDAAPRPHSNLTRSVC